MSAIESSIKELLGQAAKGFDLDANLLIAMTTVESGGNAWAMRYESAWRYCQFTSSWASKLGITEMTERFLQSCSYGLMQIMGSNARAYGFSEELQKLSADPLLGLKYACIHLKNLQRLYPEEADIISAYNQGSPTKTPGGMFKNQRYVDDVSKHLRELRKLS